MDDQTAAAAPGPGDNGWTRFLDCLRSRHSLVDLTEIGKGGMGRVYRARDEDLDRWVAVKVLDSARATPDALSRFRQESRILGSLRHPAIVGVHSARISPEGVAYFVMDFVSGGDLGSRIAARRDRGGPFTVAETVRLLRPVADALDAIHGMRPQVIHRDVKPANILVPDRHSPWSTSILTDFGISLTQDETRLTSAGFLIGTDRYMAPEQFRSAVDGGPAPGASVDRYAFTLIIVEMLTLRPLRDMMSQEAWRFARRYPGIAADTLAVPDRGRVRQINAVLTRALADNPAHRYPSATAVLEALDAATGGGPDHPVGVVPTSAPGTAFPGPVPDRMSPGRPVAHTPSPVPVTPRAAAPAPTYPPTASVPAAPPRRRRRAVAVVVGLLLAAAVGVGGFVAVDRARHPAWGDPEATIVDAFPLLLPSRQNDTGWLGMSCASAKAQEGERGRVSCSGNGSTLVVADFGDAATRDVRGSADDLESLRDGECVIRTGQVNQEYGTAFVALPQAVGRDRYSLLLSSESAADDIRRIPVC